MNIFTISLIIVFLFISYNIYIHFEFSYSIFAYEPSIATINNGSKFYGFSADLKDNKSNYTSDDRNGSQIDYLINISSNEGHSELPKFAVVGKNISIVWLDDSSGYRDVFFKRSVDGGKTFEKTINLGNIPGGAFDHQIAVMDNFVFVIWEQSPDNNFQIFIHPSSCFQF